MPAIYATAPGKVILLGEHAVVYDRPAIAIPVGQVQAKAVITPLPLAVPGTVKIDAPDIHLHSRMDELSEEHPLRQAVEIALNQYSIKKAPSLTIRITSTIPLASGMGSGAAVSAAVVRAMGMYLGKPFSDSQVSDMTYQVEKIYHGTPSGIDNSVISFAKPVYFMRSQPIQFIAVPNPFEIVIADTGIQSSTASVVGDVRQLWISEPDRIEEIFNQVDTICRQGKTAIESGDLELLGSLMSQNHILLQRLNVSSPELDYLVDAALQAGACGAKLSGAGRGGNMIALACHGDAETIARNITKAGAKHTIVTRVEQKV